MKPDLSRLSVRPNLSVFRVFAFCGQKLNGGCLGGLTIKILLRIAESSDIADRAG